MFFSFCDFQWYTVSSQVRLMFLQIIPENIRQCLFFNFMHTHTYFTMVCTHDFSISLDSSFTTCSCNPENVTEEFPQRVWDQICHLLVFPPVIFLRKFEIRGMRVWDQILLMSKMFQNYIKTSPLGFAPGFSKFKSHMLFFPSQVTLRQANTDAEYPWFPEKDVQILGFQHLF